MKYEDFGFINMMHSRKLNRLFEHGSVKRAYYADINFDILGEIIEKITNWP
mgnify:CR=1 FL=1